MVATLSPKVKQAFHALRSRVTGLPVGIPLPAFGDLMDEMKVGQLTIQRAYDMLEAQGYISRQAGKGVFVADRTQTGEFVIVVKPRFFRSSASGYYPLASVLIMEVIHEARPRCAVSVRVGKDLDVTDGITFARSLNLLEPAAISRVRGVFTFHPLHGVEKELEAAGVPVVGLYDRDRHSVWFNYDAGVIIPAVQELAGRGCRHVGIICSQAVAPGALESFRRACESTGLDVVEYPVIDNSRGTHASEGYNMMVDLWQHDVRPEGLVILDDIHARGVCAACLKLGVSVPDELVLISLSMRGAEEFPGVQLTRIEFDPMEQARHAVEMMLTLVAGDHPAESNIRLVGHPAVT